MKKKKPANGLKNLKRFASAEEAREKGRKGGIASGKARQLKKDFQTLGKILLEHAPKHELASKTKKIFPKISSEEITNRTAALAALVVKAASGDVRAFEVLRDTVGEMPVQKNINVNAEADDVNFAEKFFST